jgi:hypothetical protein
LKGIFRDDEQEQMGDRTSGIEFPGLQGVVIHDYSNLICEWREFRANRGHFGDQVRYGRYGNNGQVCD